MVKSFFRDIKEVVLNFGEDKCPHLAAALSYYAIFSISPFLVVVIAVTGRLFSQIQVLILWVNYSSLIFFLEPNTPSTP